MNKKECGSATCQIKLHRWRAMHLIVRLIRSKIIVKEKPMGHGNFHTFFCWWRQLDFVAIKMRARLEHTGPDLLTRSSRRPYFLLAGINNEHTVGPSTNRLILLESRRVLGSWGRPMDKLQGNKTNAVVPRGLKPVLGSPCAWSVAC